MTAEKPAFLRRALANLLRTVVLCVVAALALLTAAQRVGSGDPWWLELSRYLPYPALLLPALVALALSLALGRTWVIASAATLALVATLTSGLEWHDRVDAGGGTRVRLMTYNIKAANAAQRGDGFAALAQEVARHDPDIVVMQDARGLPGAHAAAPLFGLAQVVVTGEFIVASRFPLRDCAPGRLGPGPGEATYLHCVVDAHGVALNLVTAHFESPRNGLNAARREGFNGIAEWRRNDDDRRAQALALAHDMQRSARPLIVAGDLNAPESSPVVRALLQTGLRDAFSNAGRGYGYTYGHSLRPGFSFLRIDHVLVSQDLGISDCFVGGSAASDHRPVIADLVLRR